MVYESLLWLHPSTLEFIPALATHWQISPDSMTYRFRLNPNARWSDGKPVVADDVVATWDVFMDKGLQAPMDQLMFEKFEKPVAESKYIVRVKSKSSTGATSCTSLPGRLVIFPAHVLKQVDGARYMKRIQLQAAARDSGRTRSRSGRREGQGCRCGGGTTIGPRKTGATSGADNFDELRFSSFAIENLAFEMFKKGDFDFYYVTSRGWVQEMNFEQVQRGLIQKRKIFNDNPSGIQGSRSTREGAVRRHPRPAGDGPSAESRALIETLFFNEYLPLNSYFAGGIYENPNNPKMPYDPQRALKLLAEAGWKRRDAQGRLDKDGQPLVIELLYPTRARNAG